MWNTLYISLWNLKYFWLLKVCYIWLYDGLLLLYLNVFDLVVFLYLLRSSTRLHCFHDTLGSSDWSTDWALFVWAGARLFTFWFLTFQLWSFATSVVCMLTNAIIFYFLYLRNVFESIAVLLIACRRWLVGVVRYTVVLWPNSLHFLLLLLKDHGIAIICINHNLFWFE
jgi:hypothetical protein